MKKISNLGDLKEIIQAGFDDNEESLKKYGITYSTQLKAYLIESNHKTPIDLKYPLGEWTLLDEVGWYGNHASNLSNRLFLDTTRNRVWILYSLMDATESDVVVSNWISDNKGLDRCWLSRNHLLHWRSIESWVERGLGLKFSDGLYPEDVSGNFSLKAWYGAYRLLPALKDVLETAKEHFAIYSARWQKIREDNVSISAEWYSNGKVTINRGIDVNEVFLSIGEMANRYSEAINHATELRDNTMGAFELNFSQNIDLEAFSKTVAKGTGEMKLWLVETDTESDFKRFKGVDLHTWDRILLDIGVDFAYLTIPHKGCVNAVPRIATIQGEDHAGKTSIFHDGVEIFA